MSSLECMGTRRRTLRAGAVEAVIGCVKTVLRGLRRWYATDAAFRQLHSLSDRQLKDIGLHRCQIHYLTRDMSGSRYRGRYAED